MEIILVYQKKNVQMFLLKNNGNVIYFSDIKSPLKFVVFVKQGINSRGTNTFVRLYSSLGD